ncbi:MAG: thioredoxin [Paludibacter sp.]|nr:thioredoxin [Bacteroidales bacterium]MCM1069332.1 thioredoxin [Prevotella sp.]MCM1353852.1 thioredoxin [Bacteroides sp.]MCM1442898.1 thioredoxin [Muribaculum sp.]MCM1481943.1 thioredoxin [Paludibacter sp.]
MKTRLILLCSILTLTFLTSQAEEVQYLTTKDFKEKVFDYSSETTWKYKGKKPCIIDFYTTWCGPCKRLAPIMEELAKEYGDQIVVYKVDTEKERELAQYFGISSIPTLLFCPIGSNPQVAQGALPKNTLEQAIKQVLLPK